MWKCHPTKEEPEMRDTPPRQHSLTAHQKMSGYFFLEVFI